MRASSSSESDSFRESAASSARGVAAGRRGIGNTGFGLGRVFGVEIRVDWSLLIIFALITFQLGAGVLPGWHPDWNPAVTWSVAFVAAVLFFASILAHEMSHAVVARSQGIPVNRITLFLFGGLAHLEREPHSPKAEFFMAVVGPVTSGVIGVGATLLGIVLAGPALGDQPIEDPEQAARAIGPVATLLLWLGPVNVILALFNLVPGFPLDGGRVFRSIIWGITGNLEKATRWAAGAGQVFAWTLMAFGVMSLFTGGVGQGIWLLLIGWFLNNAARMSYEQLLVRQALEDVPVGRLMRTQIDRVSPDITIEELVHGHVFGTDQHAFPVERDGQMVGLVCLEDVRRVPANAWPTTPVSRIMTDSRHLSTLSPDAPAQDALEELTRRDVDQLPVLDHGHVLGLVRRRDIMKWITLQWGGPRPTGA